MTITVAEKDPDTAITYEIDVRDVFVIEVKRKYEYALTDVVRDQLGTGFYYVCTKAGLTARVFPRGGFPKAANEVVRDGSAEFTSSHPDDVSPPIISSVVWTPGGLTVDSQSATKYLARVTLSGGSDGDDYSVTARITPTTGTARDVTITVPVRSQ